jgi:hypothetical protein
MTDTFLTFGYGSNMCLGRMRSRVPSLEFVAVGVLADHSLVMNKVSKDGSAKGNLKHDPGSQLFGVVYSLRRDDRKALDAAEGLGEGYVLREDLPIRSTAGEGWDQPVLVYVADDRYVRDGLLPYRWYLRHIIDGARHNQLPAAYVERLEGYPAVDDPDRMRDASQRMYRCDRELTQDEERRVKAARRRGPERLTDYAEHFRRLQSLQATTNEVEFEVGGVLPPIKNEALSLFNEKHGCREQVIALLTAAAAAMAGRQPLTAPVRLGVEIYCPDRGHGDATNYLGGICDVLQASAFKQSIVYLQEAGLADVSVFEDDRQVKAIEYKETIGTKKGYRVRISPYLA